MAEGEAGAGRPSRPVLEAAMASAGMVVFALGVRQPLPMGLLGVGGLLVTAVALYLSFCSTVSPAGLFGLAGVSPGAAVWTVGGALLGVACGVAFRLAGDQGAMPSGLGRFVVVAALIGSAEELLYRGYVQGRLAPLGWWLAVPMAAAAHTAYKVALFAFPPAGVEVAYTFLAIATLVGGVVFGLTRQFSGSVLPPLAAHLVFDVVVYGENVHAPWWVWS